MVLLSTSVLHAEPMQLTIDTRKIIREGADEFIGINLNYIRDADSNRVLARPLSAALQEMNVHWLRYPGGEKSDFYRWAQPPYNRPEPKSLKDYAKNPGDRMDFDQYMEIVKRLKAEPYVVVGYDTFQRTGVKKEEWIKSAVAWVRYANKAKGYGVRYWEIGNENWNNHTAQPAEMGGIVKEFALAMKAVDPTILIGSGGNHPGWWEGFLPTAAPFLDFISLSLYNCEGWGGYDYFPKNLQTNIIAQASQTLECLNRFASPTDAARIKLIVAETNSKDFSKQPWPGKNNLGHALVLFDTLGRLMKEPKIPGAMVWTTRWMKDSEASNSQWYTLGNQNEILPVGMGLEMWGRFIQKQMVEVSGGKDAIAAYACQSPDQKKLAIWILNAGKENSGPIEIKVTSPTIFQNAKKSVFSGENPDDEHPRLQECPPCILNGQILRSLDCPPLSITVLTLE